MYITGVLGQLPGATDVCVIDWTILGYGSDMGIRRRYKCKRAVQVRWWLPQQ